MSATQLFLNNQLVTISADTSVIQRLNEDDQYLADYINKAAKMGQFSFLFKDKSVRRIVVRRASPPPSTAAPLMVVWHKKGRPSETDTAATALLLKLRGSERHQSRMREVGPGPLRSKIWDEIANEMRAAGYDVDGQRCSQKFVNLAQIYYRYKNLMDSCTCFESKVYPPEFFTELHKILGDRTNEDSENEWLPSGPKRRRKNTSEEDEEETVIRNMLRRSGEYKEERFRKICDLLKTRNELIKEKMKQNDKIIDLLKNLVNN